MELIPVAAEPLSPSPDQSPRLADGGARIRFETSFLNYFGRGPNGAVFDKLGDFWLDRLEDGRYEMTRVDDAWTGWLACERSSSHYQTLFNAAKLGHEQCFAECQAANKRSDELLAALEDAMEFIEGFVDVVDGPDGVPQANNAMILMGSLEAAIAKATGVSSAGSGVGRALDDAATEQSSGASTS